MPRPPSPNPVKEIHITLPADLVERMDAFLFSDFQDRVPYGARTDLIGSLLRNYLDLVEPEVK